MKKILTALFLIAAPVFSVCASALDIFACEPEWGALAQELGGDRVSIYVATNALQDPHQVQAKPSLLAKARRAKLVVCTGSELEIGWMPVVLRQSGNDEVQPGKPGYFEAADYVKKLEVPTALDRSAGDIHPGGNPHIQTDPRNIA
jgi:zinc/manganese transport system substrate-binding protein